MSEVVRKNLGGVTAYAYAKSKGYTGTEDEFAQLMANYATVGQAAEEAAEQAVNAEINAESAAQTATTKASEASSSATSAASSASAAATSETNAAASEGIASSSATAAANSASVAQAAQTAAEAVLASIPEDYSDLSEDVDDLKSTTDNVAEKTGNLFPYNTALPNTVLFASTDCPAETVLYYKIAAETGKSGYIEFFDANNIRITYIGKGSSSGGALSYEGTYIIPEDFAVCKAGGTAAISIGYLATSISNKQLDDRLQNTGAAVKEMQQLVDIYTEPSKGGYSIVSKTLYPSADYKNIVIEANILTDVYVTAKSNTNIPIAMYYKDYPLESVNWLGSFGDYSQSVQYTDQKLIVPTGTKYIAVSSKSDGVIGVKKNIPLSEASKPLFASYDGNNVVFYSNGLRIKMGYHGGNNLFDFIDFVDLDSGSTLLTNSTDFFGPYKVRATNNADGDKPENWYSHFTGGNHQYNNSGSGSTATARGEIDFVLFDGDPISAGSSGYCNFVTIQWTNYIQGQNTKKSDGTGREILKERYTLTFDGRKFRIRHYFVPLEDVLIIQYYGLQIYNNTSGCKYRYVGGLTRGELTAPIASNSGNKLCREIILENATLRTLMRMADDDIGDWQFLESQDFSVFTSGSNKAYFNLIENNSNVTFNQGNYYYFDGEYVFEKI